MNENLPPKPPAINDWIVVATAKLAAAQIDSARLDAEIILAHTLQKPRTYLHAHPEDILPPRELEIADARLTMRLDRVPIAYIVGHKEFYGRLFRVSSATLIPRPESEEIIGVLKELISTRPPTSKTLKLVDVGTGSGCLGITVKLELPEVDVTLLDISRPALNIAAKNAKSLKADVSIRESDLLSNYELTANIIIANLPYVDKTWQRSPETKHEPDLALFADDEGMELIKKLLEQAVGKLSKDGLIILEADPCQHEAILKFATLHGYYEVVSTGYVLGLTR